MDDAQILRDAGLWEEDGLWWEPVGEDYLFVGTTERALAYVTELPAAGPTTP